ncbi:MAG TPA: membrane protein insertase YidC [Actinomycetaceae bacterium]|nr:membrane protein insertase YidC [Actinomycetaceae bacterium]
MDFMSFIEVPIAWVLVNIHGLLQPLFDAGPGIAWPLAIVGLTIVIRILIMPLFFRQIKASRGMQLMQPDLQALQKKYKGKKDAVSQQAQQQEMMALYKKHNANPMASCLPLLVQMPIFIGLFNVLRALPALQDGVYAKGESIGPLTAELASDALHSTVFGAPLAASFMTAGEFPNSLTIQVVTIIMIVIMAGGQFFSMRQLTMKNMPESSRDNPMFRQQQMMMYAMPVVFAVTGVAFQVGLLLYWVVSNLWAIGQQFYMIRRNPAPGSDAYKAKQARDRARRVRKGLPPEEEDAGKTEEVQPEGQRVQPIGKARAKKKGINPDERMEAAQAEAAAKAEKAAQEEAAAKAAEEARNPRPAGGGKKKSRKDRKAAAASQAAREQPAEVEPQPEVGNAVEEAVVDDGEVRGKDGLTDAERAQRRYEQRAAQRKAAREKRLAAERRRQENETQGRYNKDS